MTTVRQFSFAGGEIAPSLYGRVDQVKYATGLRACRNFFSMRHGGIQNRPGTQHIGEVKDSAKKVRLIPFIFNADQTYVLEFGNQYIRVVRQGAQITDAAVTITGITQADPAVVTAAGHGYSNGDEVFISGVAGMTEVNGRNFKIQGVTASTFELLNLDGTTLDSTGFGTYSSGGSSARIFELTTPYLEAELPELNFVQSADVINLVHPNHAPRELTRTGHNAWALTQVVFEPAIGRPNNGAASGTGSGNKIRYRVTAIAEETLEESLPGREATRAISAATQANPVVITTGASHGYLTDDEVFITGVTGMTEINDRVFTITVLSPTTFSLNGEDGTGHGAYISGGTVARTYIQLNSTSLPASGGAKKTITWDAVTGAQEYNIYRSLNDVFGFIGVAGATTFIDDGITPDVVDTPPRERDPFDGAGNFPSAVNYYQQRILYANTNNRPEGVFASRTGLFTNFTISSPLQDDDAVTFDLVGRQVNEIRHLVELGTLVAMTTGAEWAINGDEAGILRPGDVNSKQHSYNGSGILRPLIAGGNALYVQARGSIVRSLAFDFQADGYRGNDLTIFSSHLFDNFTLVDWDYQQIPNSIIWIARSDGTLLGLTYIREHEIFAWHRHDFTGSVENVAVVPEGDEDKVYLTVRRTINGRTTRYVERMETRNFREIEDAAFADSFLKYDGRNTDTGHTMTLSGGTTWDYTETLTLTSSTAFFAASDVGNQIHLVGSDGTIIRFNINAFSSSTVVTGKPNKTVPVSMRNTAISSWTKAIDTLTNLHHLEGESLSVFGDGLVVANPNNPDYPVFTVTDGQVTLEKPYGVIIAGLPIVADMETLDIDTVQGETLMGEKKLIGKVTLFVEASRGIWVGPKPPEDDAVDVLEGLTELKIRDDEGYDDPVRLATEAVEVIIRSEWNSNGRVFVRQIDPVPLSILSVAPAGYIPFRG